MNAPGPGGSVQSVPPQTPRGSKGRRGGAGASGASGGGGGVDPPALALLIEQFQLLPGVGRRSAQRLAFFIVRGDPAAAQKLAGAIAAVHQTVRPCRSCFNFTQGELCGLCADPTRDHGSILVVEQPKDVTALEQTGLYRGLYHVLMGHVSPLEGISDKDLTLEELAERVRAGAGKTVREVILGLNPTIEGDATAMHILERLSGSDFAGVRVSRLARGLPAGSTLEFVSRAALGEAIKERRELER